MAYRTEWLIIERFGEFLILNIEPASFTEQHKY